MFYGVVKHSRDMTILLFCWGLVLSTTESSLFQYFLPIYYRPYSSWKFQFVNFFCKLYWINPRIPHQWFHTPQLYTIVPRTPIIVRNRSIHYPFLSATLYSLHGSTNQELCEKHICNQGSHHEKYGLFSLCKGSHHVQPN